MFYLACVSPLFLRRKGSRQMSPVLLSNIHFRLKRLGHNLLSHPISNRWFELKFSSKCGYRLFFFSSWFVLRDPLFFLAEIVADTSVIQKPIDDLFVLFFLNVSGVISQPGFYYESLLRGQKGGRHMGAKQFHIVHLMSSNKYVGASVHHAFYGPTCKKDYWTKKEGESRHWIHEHWVIELGKPIWKNLKDGFLESDDSSVHFYPKIASGRLASSSVAAVLSGLIPAFV